MAADPEPPARDELAAHASAALSASYQARVPAERTDAVATLEAAGFTTVNTTITMERGLGRPAGAEAGAGDVEVRPGDPSRDAAVLAIAEQGFTRDRFHLDPEIPDRVADAVKREWAANSLKGVRGDGMLVAVAGGEPRGFLAIVAAEGGGRRLSVIDLIAVAEAARGEGIGAALVHAFIARAAAEGYDAVRVGTQEANPGATRFYEREGFARVSASTDLHLHHAPSWSRG